MPTQAMQAWIKNYKEKNGRAPSPSQIQQAQQRIYQEAARNRKRATDYRKKLERKKK